MRRPRRRGNPPAGRSASPGWREGSVGRSGFPRERALGGTALPSPGRPPSRRSRSRRRGGSVQELGRGAGPGPPGEAEGGRFGLPHPLPPRPKLGRQRGEFGRHLGCQRGLGGRLGIARGRGSGGRGRSGALRGPSRGIARAPTAPPRRRRPRAANTTRTTRRARAAHRGPRRRSRRPQGFPANPRRRPLYRLVNGGERVLRSSVRAGGSPRRPSRPSSRRLSDTMGCDQGACAWGTRIS